MPDQKDDSYRLLWMLGLALTLPMILLGGPLAAFLIAQLLVKKLGLPSGLLPVFIGAGFLGSALQSYQLIKKIYSNRKNGNPSG